MQPSRRTISNGSDSLLVELIDQLQKIDENSKWAKLNELSITDNNGGRIEL